MTDIRERRLEEVAISMKVPGHIVGGLVRYILYGQATGSFLEEVMCNDLFGAIRHADSENRSHLAEIVLFIFFEAPVYCYGSQDEYDHWIAIGGLVGFEKGAADEIAG